MESFLQMKGQHMGCIQREFGMLQQMDLEDMMLRENNQTQKGPHAREMCRIGKSTETESRTQVLGPTGWVAGYCFLYRLSVWGDGKYWN